MKKIKWGIVGPGQIANKFAQAIANVAEAELVAVASRSEERATEFAKTYHIPHVFTNYEAMAASSLVDVVYIATAHPFHKPCAELFLNAKKHVLCEKPLCVNEAQASCLKAIAAENNVFLMEAMWTRFLPAVKETRAMIARGEIGELRGLSADFCYAIDYEEDSKVFENKLAGGSLLDVGVYALHLASFLLGDVPQSISAVSDVMDGVDYHTHMLLKYNSGAIASLSSAIKVEKPADAYIYGTEGSIYLPDFYQADRVILRKNGEEKQILLPYDGNGFEEEIREVCRCVWEGKTESNWLPLAESIEVIKQMDTVRKQIGVRYPLEGEENR